MLRRKHSVFVKCIEILSNEMLNPWKLQKHKALLDRFSVDSASEDLLQKNVLENELTELSAA